MKSFCRCSFLASLIVVFAPGLAWIPSWAEETKVMQGQVAQASEEARVFKSPMIIETDLKAALPENLGTWVVTREFEKFVCDSVRVRELEARVQPKKKHVRVTFFATTYTEPGHDKKVRLEFEILASEQIIGFGTMLSIDAEEKKQGSGSLIIKVLAEKWPTDAPPRLRLSMWAVDG